MRGYPQIAARIYNTPLLIHPDKATVIESVLRKAQAGSLDVEAAGPVTRPTGNGYSMTAGGVAVIRVFGTLMHRALGLNAISGGTSYTRLASVIDAAAKDADAKAILLEIDSPGGEASGLYDLAQRIIEARQEKPVWAIANEEAFSAAFAIAVSADRVLATPTGMVGSIGVIALHLDQSKRDAKQGLTYTAIFAGAHKNDLTSHAPLNGDARERMQAIIDSHYDAFVTHVADRRGVEPEAVRRTEAGILLTKEAIALNLIDGIASFSEAVESLEEEVNNATSLTGLRANSKRASPMAKSESIDAPETETPQAFTEVDITKARADGHAKGVSAGATSERERIQGILSLEEAQGREKLAMSLAMTTELDAEKVSGILASSPKETPAAGGNAFSQHMEHVGNPDIGADAASADDSDESEVQKIVNLHHNTR